MRDETKCLHSGYTPKNGDPRVMPIVQSTTYVFDSTDHIAELFDMPTEPMYSRFANPTVDAVEKKIADLEGGVGAMCTSSGQAASLFSILNLCKCGDSFISTSTIYGGTVNLFAVTLKRLGIECIFVDADADEEEIQKAFKPNTKAVFGETLANPALAVLDIEKFARIAHKNGVTGSRIMGGGFGGCTINLVKDELYDRFINDAVAEYKEKFNKQLKIYNVVISDGAHKVC